MTPPDSSAFALPDRLHAKSAPLLIADDERHFSALSASLAATTADLADRLETARRAPGGRGQGALDRDQEVHRLSARLRTLSRFGLDLCLGRMVLVDEPDPVYIGRLGLSAADGTRLLVDWRSPAAEPFFAATQAHPMGLASRRRYRWTQGRITDYWDEVLALVQPSGQQPDLAVQAAYDDQSAFIASLGSSRSSRMRDVLGTIAADQDAIIRADSRGALVVDGGPGTGKTVVALHRAAYLLHADPRLGHRRGGVLVVGPHEPYLGYVADVLPSLGEDDVQTATVRRLVAEGADAAAESDPEVAALKATAAMVGAIEPAVALYEEPPSEGMEVETPWSDLWLSPHDWQAAFAAPEPGTPHNEARDAIWEELVEILLDQNTSDATPEEVRRSLEQNQELRGTLTRAWPLLEHTDLVGDLWTVPAYLRRCAPWLTPDQVRRLQRSEAQAWTVADLPLLDAARHRLGDPDASARARRRRAAETAGREQMEMVVDHLIASDDTESMVMSMLRGEDLSGALVDQDAVATPDPDLLAGPFAHVIVDEAQELTDAEWQMLLLRCPSRSFTIVGDRAQARHGFTESWTERLQRIGLTRIALSGLTVNYRTPREIMAEAEPIIRDALPDANVPTSIRSGGIPVRRGGAAELDAVLATWMAAHEDGTACVISTRPPDRGAEAGDRVRWLTPETSKGLEFDLVVLVDPGSFGSGIAGAVDRYVAMTRATAELVVLGE